MTQATAAAAISVATAPRCSLFAICDAPADVGGYCRDHREEVNEAHRRYRDAFVQSQRRHWLDEIGVPARFRAVTFGAARPTAPIKAMLAYRDGRGVARGRAVIAASQTGTGKTYAAACLVNDLLPHLQTRQRFVLGAELVRDLLDFKSCAETMEDAASARLLVIDDLQAPPRAEGLALVEELLIRRHADCRPLVVTTNLRRQAFEAAFGDRVADRLRDWGEFVEMPGKSLRTGGT
jgi:DNA replication protein DnaC